MNILDMDIYKINAYLTEYYIEINITEQIILRGLPKTLYTLEDI